MYLDSYDSLPEGMKNGFDLIKKANFLPDFKIKSKHCVDKRPQTNYISPLTTLPNLTEIFDFSDFGQDIRKYVNIHFTYMFC